MKAFLKSAVAATIAVVALQASAQVTFYQRDGFAGRSFTADQPIRNLEQFGFNDRASSAVVQGGRWEVCQDEGFSGRCVILRPGQYGSLADMGMDNAISSVRPIDRAARNDDNRGYAVASADYRRRGSEKLFRADVTDVRAVVGPPEQRCWVERQDVVTNAPAGGANVPGAIAGAVIGGIIGHQIGGGRGRDVATAGGAVGGAALGANIGRSDQQVVSQDVQKCAYVSDNARPAYWDVTYHFNGYDHHVQMTSPPGQTVLVNAQGEPRI